MCEDKKKYWEELHETLCLYKVWSWIYTVREIYKTMQSVYSLTVQGLYLCIY